MRRSIQFAAFTLVLVASTIQFSSAGWVVATAGSAPPPFPATLKEKDGGAPSNPGPTEGEEEVELDSGNESGTASLEEVKPPMTVEEIIRLASAQYGLDSNRMVRIAQCESRLGAQTLGSGHLGIYQFTPDTWNEAATAAGLATNERYYDQTLQVWLVANPHDPSRNIWAAAWLAKRYGYGKWPVCRYR